MDDLVGRELGPYTLLDRIGTGGMATVYRGVHRALGQPRAIKILLPTLAADESLVERFKAEAKIASGLRHPNIVSIYDVGEQDALFYLVMDLVQGISLGRLLRRDGPFDLGRAVRLLRQLASAVDYAHAHGVLHRDIKASNVLVGEDDHVSLFDFGIARAAAALARLTIPGQVVGTPEYMAPEVIIGAEGDRRADFYALGVLAYQMLAGRLPFSGDDAMALLYAQVSKVPPSLRQIRPELSIAVEQVVMRQLAKEPEDRYPTAESFVDALSSAARIGEAARPSAPAVVPTPAPREPRTPELGGEDPARQTSPGLDGGRTTPLPSLRPEPDEEIVTPRPIAPPAGFDPGVLTIPPEPVYRPEAAPWPEPGRGPEPSSWDRAAADWTERDRLPAYSAGDNWPPEDRPPVQRAELVPRRLPAPRTPVVESRPGPGFGLAPIAVVVLGLVGIWALATGRLETYVGMVIGVEPTPTVMSSTRPEPTVASIVADLIPSVAAAAPPPVLPVAASPEAAAATPQVADARPPGVAEVTPPAQPPTMQEGAGHAAGPPATPEPTAMPVAQEAALPPSPEQQLQAASRQIDDGDYASAVSALGALKEAEPNAEGLDEALYRAYLGLGQQQLDQGLLDDSYASYGEALKVRADDVAALEGQKQVVLAKLWNTMEAAWGQDDAVATVALEEILALDPGYRDANVKLYALLVARADRMLGEGDVDGALVVLRRAQEVYPEGEEARALLSAHTPPPPEPEPAPAPAQNPAPPPAPAPAARPAPAEQPPPGVRLPAPVPGLPDLTLPLPRP